MQMRNRTIVATGAVLVLMTRVVPLYAQQGTRPNPGGAPSNMMQPPPQMQAEAAGAGVPFGPVLHCLRILDLTQEQKDAIKAAVDTEAPKIKALHETLRT